MRTVGSLDVRRLGSHSRYLVLHISLLRVAFVKLLDFGMYLD